ncbi:MAG: hypothetical protein ACD_58C00037G0002 [uncultured bacterium]|nr:MAG: hypothetical protein ACD_58C00037G0002 [uncultured bacterium]
MINLKFYNYNLSEAKTPEFKGETPFINLSPNIKEIIKDFSPYKNYKNYIIIGNGGSNTSFDSFWTALRSASINKSATIVTSMEPDYLYQVKSKNPIKDTLVIMISKSGDNVGALESLFFFNEYKKVIITSKKGTLFELSNKMGWSVIEHPQVGGRFSGRSAVGYGPAFLLDLDIAEIEEGAKNALQNYQKDNNDAIKLAKFLYDQEVNGNVDIFMPIYSHFLEGFSHLITQLIHESVAKNGKGQTILAVTAPESQHHSNQRFFGGPKNMIGVFMTVRDSHQSAKINLPKNCQDVALRDGKLDILDGRDLNESLKFEAQGTMKNAEEEKIPLAHIELDKITPFSVGELLVFWQFVTFYSAVLRDVNPFDQPQVERSKNISFTLRKEVKL